MASPVWYAFILNLWVNALITEAQVLSKVPKYISQEQADMILATPQNPIEPLSVIVAE